MVKIIVDAFGGDKSPDANIDGALLALEELSDIEVTLFGDEAILKEKLSERKYDVNRVKIIHAPEVIDCNEQPSFATFRKKNSSLMMSLDALASDDSYAGMVSLSSTGSLLMGSVMKVKKIEGVIRPACLPIIPTMEGGFVGVCDSGANVDCTKEELVQFAIMGSTFLKCCYNIESPKVALLNIGVEEIKGDNLRKETFPLLKECKEINFVGNMESRDLLSGKYDLVVSDGFAGNVLIKATEGTALEFLMMLKKMCTKSFKNKLGAAFLKKDIMSVKENMNPNNCGGALLIGVKKIVVKGHGSSNARSVKECIKQVYELNKNDFINKVTSILSKTI